MLKLTVVDLENDRPDVRFGSERELADYLQDQYLRTPGVTRLDDIVARVNATDLFAVKVEPYEPGVEQNRLPDGYQTASQVDEPDPWPRDADKK